MSDEQVTGVARPTRTEFGPVKRRKFLEAYRQSSNIRASCEHANVSRTEFYRTLADDPDFAAQVAVAEQEAIDRLEAKAWNNALVKDSETSLWNLLKAHRPKKYPNQANRNVNINLTAEELANLSDDELDRLINAFEGRT